MVAEEITDLLIQKYKRYSWEKYVGYMIYRFYSEFCKCRNLEKNTPESFSGFHEYITVEKKDLYEAFCAGVQCGLIQALKTERK